MSKTLPADAIERRARAAGLSLNELCRKAEIARSTFTRWKAGDNGLRVDSYDRLIDVIEAAEAQHQSGETNGKDRDGSAAGASSQESGSGERSAGG